jgi:hypothetical protein
MARVERLATARTRLVAVVVEPQGTREDLDGAIEADGVEVAQLCEHFVAIRTFIGLREFRRKQEWID